MSAPFFLSRSVGVAIQAARGNGPSGDAVCVHATASPRRLCVRERSCGRSSVAVGTPHPADAQWRRSALPPSRSSWGRRGCSLRHGTTPKFCAEGTRWIVSGRGSKPSASATTKATWSPASYPRWGEVCSLARRAELPGPMRKRVRSGRTSCLWMQRGNGSPRVVSPRIGPRLGAVSRRFDPHSIRFSSSLLVFIAPSGPRERCLGTRATVVCASALPNFLRN